MQSKRICQEKVEKSKKSDKKKKRRSLKKQVRRMGYPEIRWSIPPS